MSGLDQIIVRFGLMVAVATTITSPRLTPTRMSMRPSSGTPAFRLAISRCTATAQATASTTLTNSARRPSPMSFAALFERRDFEQSVF